MTQWSPDSRPTISFTPDGKKWNGIPKPKPPRSIKNDFLASIVVFLTALPLSMGIALASGAPVEAGLLTGIVGGLLIGFLSGSTFLVSGPAAGLSILVLEFIQRHGFAAFAVVLMVAGGLQILAGLARLGQVFRAVSPAVVNGMLSGIGIMIFCSQIYVLFDLAPKGSGLKNIAGMPDLFASLAVPGNPHAPAAVLGTIAVLSMVAWSKFAPKAIKLVPSALVAVVLVTVLAQVNHVAVHYVQVPTNIFSAIRLPDFQAGLNLGFWEIITNAFALALIASAETLLSANAVDRMHNGKRTKYDRELIAQGIGNTITGFIGGLPMTGVIARSGVNVQAGAKTRASTILHGLWLLLFVSLLPALIKMVPTCCLAALLLVTSTKLIDVKSVKKLWSYGYRLVGIYAATLVCIVCTDLLTGVLLGVVLSFAKLLYTMSRLDVKLLQDPDTNRVLMQLQGAATFLSLPKLTNALENLPPNCELHIFLEHLDYVDHACLELLSDWEQQHRSSGGSLIVDWGELHAAFKYKTKRRFKEQATIPPVSRDLLGIVGEAT